MSLAGAAFSAVEQNISLFEAEKNMPGGTHAEIGGGWIVAGMRAMTSTALTAHGDFPKHYVTYYRFF